MIFDASHVVTIIVALITYGGGQHFFRWVSRRRAGDAERRTELRRAWAAADEEARRRRIAEEYASRLVRMLTDAECVAPADIPAFPSYKTGPATGPTNTR